MSDFKVRMVHVTWVDSGRSDGWESWDECLQAAAKDNMECESVGFLMAANDDYILLAPSLKAREEVLSALQIPRCAITKPILTIALPEPAEPWDE